MPTILVIEDEFPILVALEDALNNAGYSVLTARNGHQGVKYALEEEYDLVILDIMLPKMDGMQILKRLRSQDKYVPVIMLTAKSQEKDRVGGFESGADDYMTKPFSMKELLARIKTRLKHARRHEHMVDGCCVTDIQFDFQSMTAVREGKAVDFTLRELELLRYLVTHKGRILSRMQILEDVWKYDSENAPTTRSIDNYILKLRQKIEKDPDAPKYLKTIYGRGYRFEA